jgi:hypothetical protein
VVFVAEGGEVMMDFQLQFKRLYPLFISECKVGFPALGKILGYACQLLFCGVVILVVTTWNGLIRLGDEIEKMQNTKTNIKKPEHIKKQERYDCAFVQGVTCTPTCTSWVRTRGGGGYCKKLQGR